MSSFIQDEKIKNKLDQLINFGTPQKISKDIDIDYTSNIIVPPPPQAPTQDILNQNLVGKLDDILEQPKSSNLRKLIFTMLLIFTILGICFSYIEALPRTLKVLRHGSYVNGRLVISLDFFILIDLF